MLIKENPIDSPKKEINRKDILANLLTLSIEERDSILSEHSQIIKSEFESNSDEMEWINEYQEDHIETGEDDSLND